MFNMSWSKQHCLIIAEAGVNHNGDLKMALELVHAAAEAKADIVKFQTFQAGLLATQAAVMADYQKTNLEKNSSTSNTTNNSQYEMLKKLELSQENHFRLIEECKKLNIGFLSTAFDFASLEFLISLKLGLWKIPSGEITNLPYLEKIGSLNQKVIVSTGMCDFSDVHAAVQVLKKAGTANENLSVLHCHTDYPTEMKDVNLLAMAEMGCDLGLSYGYSDHTLGIEVPIAAVALGAQVIEKHFTLSRKLEGPDHAASLEPGELKQMVSSIRNIEVALGSHVKKPTEKELKNRVVARKSLVALKPIKKGERFTVQNLTTARPGSGISPMQWHVYIGKTSEHDFQPGDLIQ